MMYIQETILNRDVVYHPPSKTAPAKQKKKRWVVITGNSFLIEMAQYTALTHF